MCRVGVIAAALLAFVAAPSAAGQVPDPKSDFLQALGQFSLELDGSFGDEGNRLETSLDALERGLERWDAAIASFDATIAAELDRAAPDEAARMHAAVGGLYLDRSRFADALRELETARGLEPSRADVQTLLGLTYRQLGRPADATEAFRRAAALDADDPGRAYVLARHLARLGEADAAGEAREGFQRRWQRRAAQPGVPAREPFVRLALVPEVVDIAPFFPPVLYAEGFALVRQGEYEQAIASLREAAGRDPMTAVPDAVDVPMRRAAAAFRDGDVGTAREQFEAAIAASPNLAEPHRLLGLAYLAERQFDDAVAHLRAAVSLDSHDERARVNLADALTEAEQYEAAEEALHEALEALPGSGRARYALARLYQRRGQYPEALREFQEALAFEPLLGLNGLYQTMGALHAREQRFDDAVAAFSARVDLVPNDPGAHQELGDTYAKQGRAAEAMAEFAVVLMLDPNRAPAQAAMAQIHLRAGRYQEALDAAERTLALDRAHREARYVRATSLMRLGRTDEGRAELATFQRLQAEDAAARSRLLELNGLKREATVSSAAGDHDKAIALLREVLLQEPGAASSHLDLGLALVAAGQFTEAVTRLETAAALNAPADVYARLAEVYATLGRLDESRRARETYNRLRRDELRRSADR